MLVVSEEATTVVHTKYIFDTNKNVPDQKLCFNIIAIVLSTTLLRLQPDRKR